MRRLDVFVYSGNHPLYQTQLQHPPEGVKYYSNLRPSSVESMEVYSRSHLLTKKIVNRALSLLKLPRLYYVKDAAKYDLIHSTRGFLILNKLPWVVDIEDAASFVGTMHELLEKNRFAPYGRKIARFLGAGNCKKILPHCFAGQRTMEYVFGKKFSEKTEVVYPAAPPPIEKSMRRRDLVRLLFVAKKVNFYAKGGKELLDAFIDLEKRYDVELVVKCAVPEEIERAYGDNPRIKFFPATVGRKELFEDFYGASDIFVLPTYIDTFGYSFLEAMSAGLPLLGTDIFAIPEIIEQGKNGFMISSPINWAARNAVFDSKRFDSLFTEKNRRAIREQLVSKLSVLIEDGALRKRMGRESLRMASEGKFSIKVRNKKLRRIYEEAVG